MLISVIIALFFCSASHYYTEAFFAQRAHLEISRAINYDLKRVIPLEYLESCRGSRICQYFRWIILAAAYYFYGWKMPVAFYVMEMLYMTFRPIPDRCYQEVMEWFAVAAESYKNLRPLYEEAQTILRSHGINV